MKCLPGRAACSECTLRVLDSGYKRTVQHDPGKCWRLSAANANGPPMPHLHFSAAPEQSMYVRFDA